MTADRLTENITSPVLLKNTTSFVKFGRSGTLISNLTKSPLFTSLCLCGEFFFHSDALLALTTRNEHLAARNGMVTGHTKALKDHKTQRMNRLQNCLTINNPQIVMRS